MKYFTPFWPILFFLLVSCINDSATQSLTNSANLELKTDKSVYSLADSTAQIAFTIHNKSDSTAYFFHCNHRFVAIIQKYKNHRWKFEEARGSPCIAMYLSGTKPVYSDSVDSDSLILSQEGKYRVLLPFSRKKNASRTDSLFSNEFILTIR